MLVLAAVTMVLKPHNVQTLSLTQTMVWLFTCGVLLGLVLHSVITLSSHLKMQVTSVLMFTTVAWVRLFSSALTIITFSSVCSVIFQSVRNLTNRELPLLLLAAQKLKFMSRLSAILAVQLNSFLQKRNMPLTIEVVLARKLHFT